MVGGGSRRDDGPLKIGSNNVFAALETLKKKKRSDKDKNKGSSKNQAKEPEPQVFWAPTPLTVKSWADVDDDDDYYATTAPPQSVWGSSDTQQNKESSAVVEEIYLDGHPVFNVFIGFFRVACGNKSKKLYALTARQVGNGIPRSEMFTGCFAYALHGAYMLQETESEDDGLDEVDDDAEEEPEHEPEVPVVTEPVIKKPPSAAVPAKDTERQLSKKELKKKEMAELESVLAELGISSKDGKDETNGNNVTFDEIRIIFLDMSCMDRCKKPEEQNVDGEKKENVPAPSESKSSKKKKAKKDKSSKEAKEPQEQPNGLETHKSPDEAAAEPEEEDAAAIDVKGRIKKVASVKKKRSNKEMDAAAKAAAVEAAARSARLAAAKKKEKNHYNQQPVR
ncbi:hypothetical protein COCNU_03G016210 [Cocos nucifera]|uniref:Uncharacterized protein n=1 Tax=Cocos nucifera TaxID=13894 RepID=A0A8K0MZ21_COCNU|nr:hypothetical protein COCNU_03G016210 [Cocos nucifera]